MPNARYASWSKDRLFTAAISKVLDENWTQVESAAHYGVSRSQLNRRVKLDREKRAKAHEENATQLYHGDGKSKSRPADFPSFEDWWDLYFSHWVCPDCNVHHTFPEFHREIIGHLESGARRVVINIPPYHSKSTLITVWWVLYKICEDKDVRIAIVSKSERLAKAFLHQIKQLMVDPNIYDGAKRSLIEDYGPFEPDGKSTWNTTEIYVAGRTRAEKDPTITVLGASTEIYGRRFDIIVMDDIATVDNQRNPDRVLDMMEWLDKMVLSRIGKSGRAIWVGTRVMPGDIYLTLKGRPGYEVVQYPALLDDNTQSVLWPEHFPYEQVQIHRNEMRPADFQLVYQNVDIPGLGASFTQEILDACKDSERPIGHWGPGWRLIGGVDPAGGNKRSGFSAFTLLAIDLHTGRRYLVEQYAERAMKAPDMKALMLAWSEMYPIYEWRVESNGLQSQIFQYDLELVAELAKRGVRLTPHITGTNKWDEQFGVETIAPLMSGGLFSIPWGNQPAAQMFQPLIEELVAFPMGAVTDRIMSLWFAELGCRALLTRAHLPMFNERMRVPNRIKNKRRVVDFSERTVRAIDRRDQRPGHMSRAQNQSRRLTQGVPTAHSLVEEFEVDDSIEYVNINPNIWKPS